jgi:hypothetical protein
VTWLVQSIRGAEFAPGKKRLLTKMALDFPFNDLFELFAIFLNSLIESMRLQENLMVITLTFESIVAMFYSNIHGLTVPHDASLSRIRPSPAS